MPAKVRVSRPDYQKFRVESLGLNIRENPGRSYGIDESAYSRNPGHREIGATRPKRKILVYSSIERDGTPVVCFISGDREYRVSMLFSATNSVLGRMFSHDKKMITDLSASPRDARVDVKDLEYAKEYFSKYGSVLERREKHPEEAYMKLLIAVL